jgi:hypothetical protein
VRKNGNLSPKRLHEIREGADVLTKLDQIIRLSLRNNESPAAHANEQGHRPDEHTLGLLIRTRTRELLESASQICSLFHSDNMEAIACSR